MVKIAFVPSEDACSNTAAYSPLPQLLAEQEESPAETRDVPFVVRSRT